MLCPACQSENRPERRFCHACAARLAPVVCTGCGFVNLPGERYCGGCGAEVGIAQASGPTAKAQPPIAPAPVAERRQMTVMFCDLVGSTALSAQLDAEDLRDLITRFQGACAAEIARYDGFIARYMGDGMLVYFGYPRAREDSAERAVRAGLAIVQAIERLGAEPVPLRARVGIATGRVVVGDIIGSGVSEERAVVGETPNLAARLQGLAEPNTVVISPRTRRLVGGAFVLRDLGLHALKGFPEPVRAWQAVHPASAGADDPAVSERRQPPLVGRDFEASVLENRWAAVQQGGGAVVTLVGESGSGKSRLLDHFVATVRRQTGGAASLACYQCSRHDSSSVLQPVIDQVSRAAGLDLQDSVPLRRAKLRTFVEGWSDDVSRDLGAMSILLSLDDGDEVLSPEERRKQMLAVLWRGFLSRVGAAPTLVVFEDVQWADPTTMEFISGLVDRCGSGRFMLAMSHRPDFNPPWRASGCLTSVSLGRLAPQAARELVEHVADGNRLPTRTLDTVLERADGVPGFIVELTRAVVASMADSVEGRGPAPLVPETLHDSLAAQLDRLGPARVVAQTAAVIGRNFSVDLLARIAGLPEQVLSAQLADLVDAGLLVAPAGDPGARYAFRHSLVGDVAYESLLKADRRRLHDRIASVVIDELPAAADADPSAIGRHLDGAGRGADASRWWIKAAERAAGQAAFREAISHRRSAIASLDPHTDRSDSEACRSLAEQQVELALTLRFIGEIEEAFAVLDQAEAVLEGHDHPATLSHVYFARGNLYFNRGDIPRCTASHERALELARQSGSALAEVRALGGVADARVLTGDRIGTAEAGDRCVMLAQQHGFTQIAAANTGMAGFGYYWCLRPDDALRLARLGEQLGRDARLPRSLMVCCNLQALLAVDRRDPTEAQRMLAIRDSVLDQDPIFGRLVFVDHLVFRAQGQWKEGHEHVARHLAASTANRGTLSPSLWSAIFRCCLLAEASPEEFDDLLTSLLTQLEGQPPNTIHWSTQVILDALFHRRAWVRLEDSLPLLCKAANPAHSPRMALWMDAATAVLGWVADPDRARGDVAAVIHRAQQAGAGVIEMALQEATGETHGPAARSDEVR